MKRTLFCFSPFRKIALICHTFLTLKLRLFLTSVSSVTSTSTLTLKVKAAHTNLDNFLWILSIT
ncbi:hypothetical protein B0192_16255 [Leptospira interrogans serovar Australis]|nr:hypothetical protein B0192_16255 [Leptospira interrogans serovar Australis]